MKDDDTETVKPEETQPMSMATDTAPKKKANSNKAPAKKKAAAPKKAAKANGPKPAAPGVLGQLVGNRTGTNKAKLFEYLLVRAKTAIPRSKLIDHLYGNDKEAGGALAMVLGGISRDLKKKKIGYELRSEVNDKKEPTIGLYPVK